MHLLCTYVLLLTSYVNSTCIIYGTCGTVYKRSFCYLYFEKEVQFYPNSFTPYHPWSKHGSQDRFLLKMTLFSLLFVFDTQILKSLSVSKHMKTQSYDLTLACVELEIYQSDLYLKVPSDDLKIRMCTSDCIMK